MECFMEQPPSTRIYLGGTNGFVQCFGINNDDGDVEKEDVKKDCTCLANGSNDTIIVSATGGGACYYPSEFVIFPGMLPTVSRLCRKPNF